jgi:hypothetical protein
MPRSARQYERVPPSCPNYDSKTTQYTEAKKVVEQAKKDDAGERGRVGVATGALAAVGVLVSLLL